MFDYHIHSNWSFDAEESLPSLAAAAVVAGLCEICFCEHIEPGHHYKIDWDGFINFGAYTAEIERAERKYPELTIRRGLEVGLGETTRPQIEGYLSGKPVDFIIASQHLIAGFDPYFPEYFEGKTKKESEETYLQCLLECLRGFEPYSVIGHIGYVNKNAPYHAPLNYKDYPDLIDEILLTAIRAGHGIEINTSGYAVYGEPMPSPGIIRRYLELGGEIITIGSDAHSLERVGGNYNQATELLRSLGAKYVCTFQKMEPVFHPINL